MVYTSGTRSPRKPDWDESAPDARLRQEVAGVEVEDLIRAIEGDSAM